MICEESWCSGHLQFLPQSANNFSFYLQQLKKSPNEESKAGGGAVENSLKTFYKEFKKV